MAPRRLARPILLVVLSVVLTSLSFAPYGQFYLAWIGLVPWLVLLAECKSQKAAFLWSWLGGALFFMGNMWWMEKVSLPGMIGLTIYCGIYWGLPGLVIRGARLLEHGVFGVIGIAAAWTAGEWLRGHVITGMPLFYLGYSQSPILALCQVADLGGAFAVTFWVAVVNAIVAKIVLTRGVRWSVAGFGVALTAFCLAYGSWRIEQTPRMLRGGPALAVIQPNYPQSNSGQKGASLDDILGFHLQQTAAALADATGKIDLVVWSETMMPPLNAEARAQYPTCDQVYHILSQTAAKNHVGMLVGGEYAADFAQEVRDGEAYAVGRDSRNSAYFFDSSGQMSDSRYDKIHLMPFGEYIPFKNSLPFLYRLFISFGPAYYSDYELQAGKPDALTVFDLKFGDAGTARFTTPICLEDLDPDLCAAMIRPAGGSDSKRADFLVNITNDGWFAANENADHLQAGIFRCIENRVPMARSVNTGISGFIDSVGRTSHLLGVRMAGHSDGDLMLDSRLTFYTRVGDIFADGCIVLSVAIATAAWMRRKGERATK
jgi:apolipoprotein N-acyltransferase